MDIVVTIGTGFVDPVERVAHGLKALLTTMLEVVDDATLAEKLIEKYGAKSALYLSELPSMLGKIKSVEFARPVATAAAAGERKNEKGIALEREQLKRAIGFILERPPEIVGTAEEAEIESVILHHGAPMLVWRVGGRLFGVTLLAKDVTALTKTG